jgi:5-methylcytosine-specific restriction protein B
LNEIVDYEIIPLLKEYWFDEPTKVKNWIANIRSAIN